MLKLLVQEFKEHAPFTTLGAITGVIVMLIFQHASSAFSYNVFYTLHPLHVLLSALVTASMYQLHTEGRAKFWILAAIGYLGSIGIATLSDSIIPYIGEVLLHLPNRGIHLGFIEKWWLVNPLALLGVVLAHFWPTTKVPHFGHVLLSTWASLFHIVMAVGGSLAWYSYIAILVFLFLSVWLPCCGSDIVFPLLFVRQTD